MVEVEMWTRKSYNKYKVSDLQEENHGVIWTEGKGDTRKRQKQKQATKVLEKRGHDDSIIIGI